MRASSLLSIACFAASDWVAWELNKGRGRARTTPSTTRLMMRGSLRLRWIMFEVLLRTLE
jgi:hypothetical protein